MKKQLLGVLLAVLFLGTVVFADEEDEDDKKKDSGVGTVIGIDLGTTYSWSVLINL